MRPLVVLTLALAGATLPASAVAQGPTVPFRLVLEQTDGGYAAHCEAGCRWTELTVACPRDCQVVINERGVFAHRPEETPTGFAFRLRRTADGWEAESLHGTAWHKVGWGCRSGACRARVDERGVSSPP